MKDPKTYLIAFCALILVLILAKLPSKPEPVTFGDFNENRDDPEFMESIPISVEVMAALDMEAEHNAYIDRIKREMEEAKEEE